jgi:anti-sigma factor RsiW
MNCKETENKIWDYIDGRLPENQAAEIEAHLNECAECAQMANILQNSMQLISNARITEPDPYFYNKLEARMERQEGNPTQTAALLPRLRYALVASVAIFGIVGGSLLGSYSAEQWNNLEQSTLVQNADDDLNLDLADNSFDLVKDF